MGKSKKEDDPLNLDAITKYNMDEMESKAYKITMLWIERSRKVFPDYRHATMKKGDPRKSLIFKIAYKLVRETKGVLEDSDYPLYVRAQIEVLKYINNGKVDPLIDPNCLVGERAWKRWKLWKKKYDTVSKPSDENVANGIGFAKAIDGFEKTKEFLVKAFSSDLSIEKFKEAYTNNNIFRWINLNKISPYYLSVSPFIKSIFNENDFNKLNFDLKVYIHCINEDVMKRFYDLFPNEFNSIQEPH